MRFIFLIFLILLLASCDKQIIEIKTSSAEKAGVEVTNIRTVNVDLKEDLQEKPKEPQIDIIKPEDGEIINRDAVVVVVNVSNFKLVSPDRYPQEGQGHIQVWVDDMEYRSSKTVFVFENQTNGTHIIKAELMMSNNTVLNYSKTIKVFVNRT